jgi:tRNA pseudouridine55 synthase
VAADRLIGMGEVARGSFTWVQVDEPTSREVHFGRPVSLDLSENPTALLDPEGDLLALYQPGEPAKPVAVFVS